MSWVTGAGNVTIYSRLPFTINCGGSAASPFLADSNNNGGSTFSTGTAVNTAGVTNPAPQSVYQSERYGPSRSTLVYTLGGLISGSSYTVRLHFSENFVNAAGQRQFNVIINGLQVLTNFDVFGAAGGKFIAIVREFTATPDGSNQIVIQFAPGLIENAKCNGIELISLTTGLDSKLYCSDPAGFSPVFANDQIRIPSAGTSYFVVASVLSPSLLTVVGTWGTFTANAQLWAYLFAPSVNLEAQLTHVPVEVVEGASPDASVSLNQLPVEVAEAASNLAVVSLHHLPVEVLFSVPRLVSYPFTVRARDVNGCVVDRAYNIDVVIPNDPSA